MTLLFATAVNAQEAVTPLDSSLVNLNDFPTTWDGSPAKFAEKASLQTFSFFQLFWFAGNNLCDSATKSRIESQLSQQEGKTVTCSATTGLGAFEGTCDWWCDAKAIGGINCQGDQNKCSIQDKCVNNQCVPVTCGSNQYVSNHGCNEKLPTQTCTDSDGGDKPLSKGSTYLNGKFVATDQCSSDGRQLQEKYCSGTIPNSKIYSCTYGCSGGACLEQKITSCTGKPDGTIITSYCDGNIAKQTTCSGQVEFAEQSTCTNFGKTCAAGECVTPSSGTGGDGGSGGTGGVNQGGDTGSGGTDCGTDAPSYNCCSYASIDHDFCKGQTVCAAPRKTSYLWLPEGIEGDCTKTANIDKVIGGNIAETSKSEDSITCINSIGTPSGCLNQKAKDYQQNQKQTGGVAGEVFSVEPSSVPSLSESLKDSRESDVLKSLCIDDDYCKSENCDDSKNTRDEIHKVVANKDSLDSSIGKIDNRFKPIKLMQPVQLTGGKVTKAGEEIGGVCTEEFDFSTLFKENQTAILIGGGILAAALVLPRLMGK